MTAQESAPPGGLTVDVRAVNDTFTLDVAFDVAPGSTVAVVGPNGAGKSTLIAVLAGFLPIDRGAITFDGLILDEPSTATFVAAEHRPVALVPQDGVLFPHMSVLANVTYGLRHRRADLSREAREERARAALDDVALGSFAGRRPSELSGGQAQRAAVARALVLDAPVLLLDEPLSNIDVDNRQLIRKLLQERRPPGQIQIVVTHGRDHAHDADELLVLESGTLAARGRPDELAAAPPSPWLAQLLFP
ncbi:MAG: ATP-binding cassette domain-containing protein [Actinomycetota bacterium]